MNWVRHSLSLARNASVRASVTIATATMAFTPVAQGAAAKNENVKSAKAALASTESASREPASVNALPKGPNIPAGMFDFEIDKAFVSDFFKATDWGENKKVTVGEFYSKLRPILPHTMRKDLDKWATLNHNSLMPAVQVSTYKGTDGKEQIRMLLTTPDKKTTTLSFDTGSEKKFLKYNNVNLSKKDLIYYEQGARKIATQDKDMNAAIKRGAVNRFREPVLLSFEEYKRFTPAQRAEYFIKLRYLVEASQQAMKAFRDGHALNEREKFQEFVIEQFLGQTAEAAKKKTKSASSKASDNYANEECMINGYFSIYGETSSCGGGTAGRANLKSLIPAAHQAACGSSQVPCNPLVYAYADNGKPFCVSRNQDAIRFATSKNCPDVSPLRKRTPEEVASGDKAALAREIADKKKLIESYMNQGGKNNIDLKFSEDGKLSQEQYDLIKGYVGELNAYISLAEAKCNMLPLSEIKEKRYDQKTACEAIAMRKIDIDVLGIMPSTIPVVEIHGKKPVDCNVEMPGSYPDDGNCVCIEPMQPSPDNKSCESPQKVVRGEAPEKCKDGETRDEKTGQCAASFWNTKNLLIGGLFIGAAFLIFGGKKHDPPKLPTPQKPFDPCPPAPYACTGQTPQPTPTPPPVIPSPIIVSETPAPTPGTTPSATPDPGPPIIPVVVPTPVVPTPVPDQRETSDKPPGTTAAGVR